MPTHSRRRRRGSRAGLAGRGTYLKTGGTALLGVREPTEQAAKYWDGPREMGPLVVGGNLQLPYIVDAEYSRYVRLKAKTYDAVGSEVDPAVTFAKRKLSKFPSSVDLVQEISGPLSGIVSIDIRASRGDGSAGALIWWAGVDGEQFLGLYEGVGANGTVVKTLTFDSRRYTNGKHRLTIAVVPDPPPAAESWPAALDVEVEFQNGNAAMQLKAPYYQLVVTGAVVRSVLPVVELCDGTTAAAAGPVTVTSTNLAVATVAGTDVTFVGEGWTQLEITDQATGLSTIVRAARYPAGYTALPHIRRDWAVGTAYDAAQSRTFVAPFHMGVVDARNDELFRKLLKEGHITTFSEGVSPGIGEATLAQFQSDFDLTHAAVWPFLTANPEFDCYLVWDGIARTRYDAYWSRNNPDAAAAYQWVLEQWKTKSPGFGITMIDEVVGPFQFTPTPTDGRWDHFTATAGVAITDVTDNTHIRVDTEDFSTLPFPAQQPGAPLMKPRVFVKSGPYAGKQCRVTSGDAAGNLVLELHDETGGRLDLATEALTVGTLILVSGWWSNSEIALPDDTITNINAKLRAGAFDIPFGYAPAAHVPGWSKALWFAVGDLADIYATLSPANGFSPYPVGAPGPQAAEGHDYDWYDAVDEMTSIQPLVGLTGATGYYYTKTTNDPKEYYDPATDVLHAAGQDARYSGFRTALVMVEGGCGTRTYLFDTYEQRQGRIRETYPRTQYGEPLQTGFHPYVKNSGSDKFWAIAAVKRTIDQLNAKWLMPLGEAPTITHGIRTSYRNGAEGRLLLALNTLEAERTSAVAFGARWYAGGKATRWRQQGMMTWTEHVPADNPVLTFLPCELSTFELHDAAANPRPAVKWKFPFEPALALEDAIAFRIEADAAVPIASVAFYLDGDLQATVNAADVDGLWSWEWDALAWTQDYENFPRREVWLPIKAVVTSVAGAVAEIYTTVMLAPGEVAQAPQIVLDDLIGFYGADELVTVDGTNQLIVWESNTPAGAIDISASADPQVLQTHADGLPELYDDGAGDGRITHGGEYLAGEFFLVVRKDAGNFDSARGLLGMDLGSMYGVAGTENLTMDYSEPFTLRVDGVVTNALAGDAWHIVNLECTGTLQNTLNRVLFGGRPWEGHTTWKGAIRAYAMYDRVLTAEERQAVYDYLASRFLP